MLATQNLAKCLGQDFPGQEVLCTLPPQKKPPHKWGGSNHIERRYWPPTS